MVMSESDSEVVAELADRVVVLYEGKIASEGTPRDVFVHQEQAVLARMGITMPYAADFAARLNGALGHNQYDFLTLREVIALLHNTQSEAPA